MNPEQNYHEKCICQICNCGKHKCPKPHPKGDFTTSYTNDYQNCGPVEQHTPVRYVVTQKKQQAYQAKHYDPKDLVSNYQGHYVPKSAMQREPPSKLPKNFVLPESGFQGQSSYNNSYRGYNGNYRDLRAEVERKRSELPKGSFVGQSTYNANYIGASMVRPDKVIMKDSLELAKGAFDGITTYQRNYTEKPGAKPEVPGRPRSRKDLIKNNDMFTDNTAYTDTYLGVMVQKTDKFVPKGELSLGNHSFDGQTNYNAAYRGLRPEPRSPIIPNSGVPVLPVGSFQGDSTYGSAYQHVRALRSEAYRPKETPLAQGAFKGQSTYSDHYMPSSYNKPVNQCFMQSPCPAVVLQAPSYNLLDQEHLKYNSKLNMWT